MDEVALINSDSENDPFDPDSPLPTFRSRTTRPKSKYESLDYDVCENELWEQEQISRKPRFTVRKDFARWIVSFWVGILTAGIGCIIAITIDVVSFYKYSFLQKAVKENIAHGDLVMPYIFHVILNILPVIIGSVLVTYVEPVAAGSGIPLVKCYLNGIKIPKVVRLKTLVVKAIGVITSVIGGLAGGKEGPMVHCGAVIAAGISQGKSSSLNKDIGIFRYFRDDHEKRDFVVGGASAGVAAAFNAPIGGLLFSLEEAASFWNQSLIWRTLFASVVSSFTLNLVLSAYHGLENFTYHGLFNLGEFEALPFEYYELPIYILMGIFGGLSGALWISLNYKLNMFRESFIKKKWLKVVEAILVTAISATFASFMMYLISDCRPLGNDPTTTPVQLFCEDNEYNAAAALWFQTPEASVKSLFHDPPGSHRVATLLMFVPIYFFLSNITYGLNVSLGIFIPCLLVGAAWGRLVASFLALAFPGIKFINPGKYALVGAAAQLGGTVRMTISLAVILIETTGNIWFALPIIVTLTSSKWMGDYFNDGIYDTQIKYSKVPILHWHAPSKCLNMKVKKIMSEKVVCVKMRESVEYIVKILQQTHFNGFPVVDEVDEVNRQNGRLRGIILRSQLIVILKRSFFEETRSYWEQNVSIEAFRNEYPRYPSIRDIAICRDKGLKNLTINFELFMNKSPYDVNELTSVPRAFMLFRALGLRHLVIVDADNHVTGIITRKDFLK
ncbi:CLUMA_CG016418, isoform A [Clunio marinus]|uniref:Chloride channel protein n=1 Tax=Clunio marinus TaxID=568069 RepID=A0A1J1IS27_9DIPT|nr:CLUMA_CG016418, isoform A [Clunio marinus]